MSKLQILNETQVQHFVDAFKSELIVVFKKKEEELKTQAKTEQNKFITHVEVLKLKEEQKKDYDIAEKIVNINISLKEIGENYFVCRGHYYGDSPIRTIEDLVELKKRNEESIIKLLYDLSKESLMVNESYTRREQLLDDLRARLSMTVVDTFDNVKEAILKSIDINSYFSYTI